MIVKEMKTSLTQSACSHAYHKAISNVTSAPHYLSMCFYHCSVIHWSGCFLVTG